MRIALSAGHTLSGKGTGAVGVINESQENRVMFDLVKKWLVKDGHTVYTCNVDKSDTYLQQQVALANKQTVDLAVQIHFNAGGGTGTETLYFAGTSTGAVASKNAAIKANAKLATVFKDRGVKARSDLYWLNNTNATAILIETCFVDSATDTTYYKSNKDKIAKLMAEGIVGRNISDIVTPPPIVPPPVGGGSGDKLTTAAVNLRTTPSWSGTIVVVVPSKAEVTTVAVEGAWTKVKYGTHTGYVANEYLIPNPNYKPPTSSGGGGYVVGTYNKDVITTDVLNVRSGRGSEFTKLGQFASGTKVNVWYIDKAKDGTLWGSCSYNGGTGYISMTYTKPV